MKKFAVAVKSNGVLEVEIVSAVTIYGAIWGHTQMRNVKGNEWRFDRMKRKNYSLAQIKEEFSREDIDLDLVVLWEEDFR